jgi:ABC-type oligopeptide transport system substrate-binding subunit
MKKYTLILAVTAMIALTACGSGSTTNETTDSTATQVDTSAVQSVDTTKTVGADSVAQ